MRARIPALLSLPRQRHHPAIKENDTNDRRVTRRCDNTAVLTATARSAATFLQATRHDHYIQPHTAGTLWVHTEPHGAHASLFAILHSLMYDSLSNKQGRHILCLPLTPTLLTPSLHKACLRNETTVHHHPGEIQMCTSSMGKKYAEQPTAVVPAAAGTARSTQHALQRA